MSVGRVTRERGRYSSLEFVVIGTELAREFGVMEELSEVSGEGGGVVGVVWVQGSGLGWLCGF